MSRIGSSSAAGLVFMAGFGRGQFGTRQGLCFAVSCNSIFFGRPMLN